MRPSDLKEDPESHLVFITSKKFEGQCFERKEITDEMNAKKLRELLVPTVSGFANSNREGGILVLGVTNTGKISGMNLCAEQVLNTAFQQLRDLNGLIFKEVKVSCENRSKEEDYILLICVEYSNDKICETLGNQPKGWERRGAQNYQLTFQARERMAREKGIIDFEIRLVQEYKEDELEEDIYREFKDEFIRRRLRDKKFPFRSNVEFLEHVQAVGTRDGKKYFTESGSLFFSKNPKNSNSSAYVRLLRYDESLENSTTHQLYPTFDRDFNGPIISIIREIGIYFKDSAFFKELAKRLDEIGILKQLEYPLLAVNEMVINALIHRDYGTKSNPIFCIAYSNAFVVKNPGNSPQLAPAEFELGEIDLKSVSRNRFIVDWTRTIADDNNQFLAFAMGEGTKKMLVEMSKFKLPAPQYKNNDETTVILYNQTKNRKDKFPLQLPKNHGVSALTSLLPKNRARDQKAVENTIKGNFIDDYLSISDDSNKASETVELFIDALTRDDEKQLYSSLSIIVNNSINYKSISQLVISEIKALQPKLTEKFKKIENKILKNNGELQTLNELGLLLSKNQIFTSNGFVIYLSLRYNNLTSLPEKLFSLKKLQALNLGDNQLASLPESLASLQELRALCLSGNQLSSLPKNISKLYKIKMLNLDSNQLSSLPERIFEHYELQNLSLKKNLLSSLPESIFELYKLQILALDGNQLHILPKSISELQKLQNLTLKDNRLSSLPESISELYKLQILDLNGNQLSILPKNLYKLQKLRNLNLKNNRLSSFPESISEFYNLQILDLDGNQLSILPKNIYKLQKLQNLHLKNNALSSLPESISSLHNLQELDLSYNKLSSLPGSISSLQKLRELRLGGNRLSSLPKSISSLHNLRKLDLSHNQLSSLPESIGSLKNLQELGLRNNKLSSLPESIGSFKNLQELDLSNNQLSSLPESIGSLKKLKWLTLNGNKLSSFPENVKDALKKLRNNGCDIYDVSL